METVELVIKIPEELYKAYKGRPPMLGDAGLDMIAQSIANGTVLPKGHGDLVDMNTVTSTYNLQGELTSYDAVVVLEADKEA